MNGHLHHKDLSKVEVIVVDAKDGGRSVGKDRCDGADLQLDIGVGFDDVDRSLSVINTRSDWGNVSVIKFIDGGGRWLCLNFGAAVACGRILTFFLLDTTIPDE
jgi:hypothetical protein